MKYKSLLSLENQNVWHPWVLFAAKTVLLEPRRTLTDPGTSLSLPGAFPSLLYSLTSPTWPKQGARFLSQP